MNKIGIDFYCTLNDNYHPTIYGWEEECSVCYPKNLHCLECKDHGLWRSRIGTEHYGLPQTFNESLLENMGYQIYVPPTTDNYVCIIPCYECAKNNAFTWGEKIIDENNTIPIECNGVNTEGEIKNEFSLHDLCIYLIKQQCRETIVVLDREIMFSSNEHIEEIIRSYERIDLEIYLKNIRNMWICYCEIQRNSEGFHNFNYHNFNYHHFLECCEKINDFRIIEEIVRGSNIIQEPIYNINVQIQDIQDIQENNDTEEIVNVQDLCRNGIDILDSVMSYDDMDSILNEENYRQLMDIFQKIYNSQ